MFKNHVDVVLRPWFRDGPVSVRLMVGLGDPRGLFQHYWVCDSVNIKYYKNIYIIKILILKLQQIGKVNSCCKLITPCRNQHWLPQKWLPESNGNLHDMNVYPWEITLYMSSHKNTFTIKGWAGTTKSDSSLMQRQIIKRLSYNRTIVTIETLWSIKSVPETKQQGSSNNMQVWLD